MIKVENVPLDKFPVTGSDSTLSDDSRFIYFFNSPNARSILAYDVMYNSSITLKADISVIEVYETTKNLLKNFSEPGICAIDETTLVIHFAHKHFGGDFGSLLILVNLNFGSKCFSFLDKIYFHLCANSCLSRDCKNKSRYVLMHTFDVHTEQFFSGNEFYGCYIFEINNNHFYQSKKERIILDYDVEISDVIAGDIYLNDNELWMAREIYVRYGANNTENRRAAWTYEIQISYFNLNEPSPKEIPVRRLGHDAFFHWADNFVVYIEEPFENFKILKLDDKTWSDARNNERLLNDHSIKTWELFYFANPNCKNFGKYF